MNAEQRRDGAEAQVKAAKAAADRSIDLVKSAAPQRPEAEEEQPKRPLVSVTDARANLAAALAEFDEAISIKGSMRRHPAVWAVAGGLAAAGLVGALVWAFRKR